MVDLFDSADSVVSILKSSLETFFITKNQIRLFEKDSESLGVFHIHSKNGKKFKVKVEEEK